MAAIYVQNSKNSKLCGKRKSGKVDCTYAPIKNTCPDSCQLKNSGCYAVQSYVGITNARLTKQSTDHSALDIARQEAKAIDNSHGGQTIPPNTFLRLHVSGDTRTVKGSKLLNSAVGRWRKRGGTAAWSYTHAWKNVPAKTWTHVSVLASVDTIEQANQAVKNGYAPAIVVSEHLSDKAYRLKGSKTKWIPCPAQTREDKVGCLDCLLCAKSEYLKSTNHGIAFAAHGVGKNAIKRRLEMYKGE